MELADTHTRDVMRTRQYCRAHYGTLVLTSLLSPAVASSGSAQGGNELRPDMMTAVESDASSAADAPLAGRLAGLLGSKVRNGTWGAMVISLTTGDTLFSRNAGMALNPASTLKLYTTALAFERLGPNHRFTTDVFRQGMVSNGTLSGHLILRGGGDPALSRRFFDGDGNGPMRALARQVADAGIRHVLGDVIGDDRAFEAKSVPDGWLQRYLHASYAARVSALSLNENLIHVVVTPGRAGQAGAVRLEPATTAFTVTNASSTRSKSRGAQVTVLGGDDGVIRVRGWIGASSEPRVYALVVPEPALFTTGAFARALNDIGITVEGKTRVGVMPAAGVVRVASLPSPPLAELAGVMNRESINHYAELIFRNAARQASPMGVGSATMGNALLRDFMQLRVGAAPTDVYAADGSGLSTLDRVTARSMVKLLSYAHRAPWSRQFHESLPVAGREETLRLRMRQTPAQGNLHAKTGTTNDVVALSGYVAARTGEILAFSFLYNGKDRWNARATIDAMGVTLADFAR